MQHVIYKKHLIWILINTAKESIDKCVLFAMLEKRGVTQTVLSFLLKKSTGFGFCNLYQDLRRMLLYCIYVKMNDW